MRPEASSLGMQAAPSSIPTSGTFFRGDLVMKTFLRPFSLFRWFKKSICQLLAKECALSTGKLPRRLAQEQCGLVNWPRPKWSKICRRAVKQKSNETKMLIFDGHEGILMTLTCMHLQAWHHSLHSFFSKMCESNKWKGEKPYLSECPSDKQDCGKLAFAPISYS